MLTDVSRTGGAEERIGEGVEDGVGIGVSGESACLRDPDASQNERATGVERVNVDALADADHVGLPCRRYDSARARSSGRVIFRLRASPGTD